MSSGLKINIVNPKDGNVLEISPYRNGMDAPEGEEWAQDTLNKIGEALRQISESQRDMGLSSDPITPYFTKNNGEITVTPNMGAAKSHNILHLIGTDHHPVIILHQDLFNSESAIQTDVTVNLAYGISRLLNIAQDDIMTPSNFNPTPLHSTSPLFQLALQLDTLAGAEQNNEIAKEMLPDIRGEDKDAYIENAFNVCVANKLGNQLDTPFDIKAANTYVEAIVMTDAIFRNKIVPGQAINPDYNRFLNALRDPHAGLGEERFNEIQEMMRLEPELRKTEDIAQAREDVMNVINRIKEQYMDSAIGKGGGHSR